MTLNYGLDEVHFLNSAKAGAKVRGHEKIIAIEKKINQQYLVT